MMQRPAMDFTPGGGGGEHAGSGENLAEEMAAGDHRESLHSR
jgi:hypothetical protein